MQQQVREWPNGLGYDLGECEAWKHLNCFRVFTPTKCALVSFEATTDPAEAIELTRICGLSRQRLEAMPYHEAQILFSSARIMTSLQVVLNG